ncbi:MAG: FecR domain-containing protein [Alistipes sp.]|nr:FecR domain-containing protein [Alistipes sp.]
MKTQEQIEEQLHRYMQGKGTAEECIAAENWLQEHVAEPEYDPMFRRLLDATPVEPDAPALQRIRRRLEMLLAATADRPVRSPRPLLRIVRFAAAAVLLVAALVPYLRPAVQTEWYEIYVAQGETREITLSDGTQLWLNSGSRVFYPERFDGRERRIRIDGEVFADVAKDRRHPFVVSASDVEVRVLGTQFSLKSYAENPNIEVALIEGSVAMRAGNPGKSVDYTLTPGDMIRYNRTSGSLETYRIDTETYGSWHSNRNLCFVNQTLGDIATDLERRFNVKIIIEGSELAEAQYYASFINNESLDRILRALNSNDNMRISRINGTIIISPN